MTIRLPIPSLVVLVGPAGAGKTTWADRNFRDGQVVSSDRLRALVGEGEFDQRASADAFAVLESIVERRLARGLVTVVDTLGTSDELRAWCREAAARAGMPCFAVVFDTEPALCRKRNATRARPVPKAVLDAQIRRHAEVRAGIEAEGFAAVFEPDEVRLTTGDGGSPGRHTLDFGLQLSSFEWEGGPAALPDHLSRIAVAAEDAGFSSLWVMDHFRQIPQVGRPWWNLPESYTTLAWLAARTATIKLGVLVSGVTYRNPAHLGKIVATLDVLSGGRALCGLGAAWWEAEHRAYGWAFPSTSERLDVLEDTLQILPLLWGPGTPRFEGKTITIEEAICYPRPIQEHIPIVVGGGGERRTLRLVARYANACNLMGAPDLIRHKVEVLGEHCASVGRDPAEVTVTHFGPAVVASADRLPELVERLRPPETSPEAFAVAQGAGTPDDLVARYADLAGAGVETAIVSLAAPEHPRTLRDFAEVIEAFA